MSKTIDIFIKSYSSDFKLLKYALLSITKNVTGYNNLILLIPEAEKELFDTRELPERTLIHYVPEYGNKYLLQQVFKLNAFKYSFADYILFSDSDVIFDHPINLQEFIEHETPEILYTSWDKVGDGSIWREPTERILGDRVEWEFMRRNCLVYHRSTLINLHNWNPNVESLIMYSDRFSEFNLIGAWAYKHEPHKYRFVNTDNWEYVPPKGEQLWSYADNNGSDLHKQEYKRSIETINNALGLNITEL